MSMRLRGARRASLVAVVAAVAVAMPTAAHADREDGHDETEGESDGGGNFGAGAGREQMRVTFDPPASGPDGALTSSVWTPPACYYAPIRTPAEMEAYWADLLSRFHTPPWPPEDVQSIRNSHEAFLDEYPDYNIDQQGEGTFWSVVRNRDYPIGEQLACEYKTFWVDFTDPLPVEPHAVNVEILAALAWEETRVPDTEVSVNPAGSQKVNLPMWVWLDETDFAPVTVEARLDDYGVWARTTATPKELTLDPGTDDATVYPADQVCRFRDGRVGEPYERGRAGQDPPCGVRYERATHATGDFPLRATLTWEVTWRDHSDPTPRPLADGTVTTTVDVSVEEIQTIVRP